MTWQQSMLWNMALTDVKTEFLKILNKIQVNWSL